MRKIDGQPNEFGTFVPAEKPTAPPVPAVLEEPQAEEAEGDEDSGWTKKGKRKSK